MTPVDVMLEARDARLGFNFEFLVFFIICGLLTVFFLLYFNRLFASAVSYAIRTYTWHTYRVYIDIKAIQISLLGGRIFFTGLRYHGSNETFLVQHGDITWRYWLRRVRDADINLSNCSDGSSVSDSQKNSNLPCRIHARLVGVEWFVYNRSPAYNDLLNGLLNDDPSASKSSGISNATEEVALTARRGYQNGSAEKNKLAVDATAQAQLSEKANQPPPSSPPERSSTASQSPSETADGNDASNSLPPMLQLLPIHVEFQKPALVVGNDNTKAILVLKANSASTIVDAGHTNTVDPYRQLFKIEFDHPVIEMRENDEFKEDQVARATRRREDTSSLETPAQRSFFRNRWRKVFNSLRNMVPYFRRSVESFSADSRAAMGTGVSQIPGSGHWQGLSRYLDDRYQDDKSRWSSVEYGAVNTILDSPSAALTVYWDSVSKVTANARRHSSSSFHTSINGTEPPAWGMSLSVKGGTVNYGPWADRQRADLQRVFYPTLCKNSTAAVPLAPGSWRVATQFNLFVELEDAVTLRIPTREESKNWRWFGKEPPIGRQGVTGKKRRNRNKKSSKGDAQPARPAGWLEIKVPSNSTVSYSMDMLGRSTGYQNRLDIDLPSTELRSSVNHDLMWKSGPQRVSCDLSNPLTWNTLRNWSFNITCDDMKLYLLRDHIFLLTDLVDDWASGPPSEYLVFTPYIYHLKLNLNNLQLYLNVNDENIIDKATAHDDNTYLILSSPILKAETSIPLDKFRPSRNSIPFDIRADTFDLKLHTPQSNTQAAFLSSNELGHGESLAVTGSYEYNATTSVANTDTLILNVHGQSPYAYLYGFIIRYVILLKENYFGDFVHFRTLDEYQAHLQLEPQKSNTDALHRPPNKKSNDLDVILSVRVDDPRILLPVNLYSASRYVQCELANLSVDLRFTNYYMDLELLLSPLSLSLGYPALSPGSPNSSYTDTQLFVDGVRVFGHRTFGLPPSEPTYLCNWDVSVGMVDGECTADFLTSLAKGGVAFGFMFDDVENALVPYSSLVFHDVTFVRVDVASVRLWLHVDEAAFLLSTGSIQVRSNDWGGTHYSKRANIGIPNIEISCVNAESASRHTSRRNHPVDTAAYLKTDVQVASIGRKFHFQRELKMQQDLIRREDQRTGRTPFLLRKPVDPDFVPEPFDPPAQCVPPPAFPLTEADDVDDNASYRSIGTSRFSGRLRRQSSFLSSSSSHTSLRSTRTELRSRARSRQAALSTQPSGTEKERRVPEQRGSILSQGLRLAAIQQPIQDWQQKEHTEHSSVAFSSQYFAPHFPLESVRPDGREATFEELEDEADDDFFGTGGSLDDLDPNNLSDDHAQASTMIEFTTGITAFISPEAVRYVNSLLSAFQPSEPDDILDSLQTSTIGDIFSEKKQRHITGSMQDILVKLPKANIRFLDSSMLDSPDASQEEQDQYDIRISKTLLITRTVKDRTGDNVTSRTSLHFRLKSAEISASERLSSIETPQAAIMVNIDDVSVSLGAKDITYFDADIGSIVGSTASGKVEYLASLIHRTGSIASELGNLLSETASRNDNRIKYLVSQLLEDGHATNDPSFLIRPSAVLRSTHEHMRTADSWKLMMRLRQIWATLSQNQRRELIDRCRDNPPEAHPDVADRVVSSFQKWRSWDLHDPRNAVLMKKIFGKAIDDKEEPSQEYPLLGACRLDELQFVLDPGPKQNNIGFLDIALRVDRRPPGQRDVLSEMKDFDGSLTILNLCCAEAAIHLNWELCELADDVLRLYTKAQPQPSEKTMSNKQPKRKIAQSSAAYHVVFEVVKGSMEAETVNLTAKSIGDGLKTSILLCHAGEELSVANVMLTSNAVTSKLQSHGKILGVLQIQKPSVFIAHELHKTTDIDAHVVKVSASSPNLALRVKDDPIGLLEVLDLLIRDEAAQVYRLKELIPSSPEGQKKRDKIKQRISTFVLNVAMFLDGYIINIPLLQSLTYKITGSVARASCAANFGKDIVFDFDIKENSHEMQINVKNEPRSISLLEIPPANGRITSNMQSTENLISVLASMEVIRLDASAIYSLLAALNRPQISGAIEEAQQQVKIIQGHVGETFGTQRELEAKNASSLPTSTPNLVYNIHFALAGLRILARTHLKTVEEPMAQILFALEKVTLQASNQQDPNSSPLKYPDLYVNLRQISLDIRRGKENSLRSCGNLTTGINISASSQRDDDGREDWSLHFRNDDLTLNLSPETVSTIVDVVGYMGSKIRDLDTSRELEYLRKLRQSRPKIRINDEEQDWGEETDIFESVLSSITYRFELRNICFCWDVADGTVDPDYTKEDLVLSIKLIEFGTRTRKSARLTIEDFLLQTVPPGQDKTIRSLHSALLPEVMFNVAYVSTADARRMAFQAVGDSLDLRLTSGFIVPAANLIQSISLSMKNAQAASSQWTIEGPAAVESLASKKTEDLTPTRQGQRRMFGNKRLEKLLVDADFAGAVVYVSTKRNAASAVPESKYSQPSLAGKYGQFSADDSGSGAVLRSPGLAWKAEYRDNGKEDPSLYGEIKINASSNILYPSVVPLVLDILSSVKKVVSHNDANAGTEQKPEQLERPELKQTKSGDEDNFLTADPSAVLGRLRLNLGLRICRQEFSLSCQPIARVSATACFDSIYFTLITVTSQEQGNFFAISGVIAKPQASVQHVYSRDSTASFELDSVAISFMNSKHFSGTSGVSAILNVSPMKVSVNAKQVQDFLLFREIWYPEELRQKSAVQVPKMPTETSQAHLVQRYQEVAATAAFPWTATISIAALDVCVDLGQSIGKSVFQINEFWVSSKKTSDWEQNLCLGFRKVGVDCTGRLSGFVALQDFRLRSSIQWPQREEALNETPLVQASLAFNALRVKAAFDYQAFLVADITSLEFLMYNVRDGGDRNGDRLVAIFDGEAVQVFGTTTSIAQTVALYQALQKLIEERRENFESSVREIEKFMKRKSISSRTILQMPPAVPKLPVDDTLSKSPISLDTDVVVTLKALNLGVFPSTFSDHQVFKMEALNAYARFAASIEQRKIHSILRMTLGQLRIGLAGVRDAEAPKMLNEMTVEDVVQRATGSRGGTILKVPRVEAVMETWQKPSSNHIDYIFKSAFEGKVEVGWNYSRISYIRGMWANHSKSLEQTWGRQLPMTAVKITGVPETEGEQQKITAEVNVPQSKYDYLALEPPVIETPQLRDMGEATPPLEWIGLHRDRLPNLTHQIVIVSLLELAGEVEDAYSRILGST
ncbi:fermentation associated protein [Metarhizium acridum]|uniref:fermentation associated protein n=1 Tax=Metarhizium acridum TaxID=92637 RepID=UPI001C6AB805|nr:fermentation associated protein [Metarhizium acridum]